ncbi:hypothetical protein N7481_003466 [Penicillium waksmanii]|uniref:uncharacterized protein n=1 Tax=Penicillium waksmanii TaxID=69791 RepID=UPI002548C023|nr:uncharacterized protein N7481_003466 [Penicillium waksmanii]KAJ5988256.1 hypothetical protein N7481_003466 [Penicillium waksmanii]
MVEDAHKGDYYKEKWQLPNYKAFDQIPRQNRDSNSRIHFKKRQDLPMAIPTFFLQGAAASALQTILKLRVEGVTKYGKISDKEISEDATLVLKACEALQKTRDQEHVILDEGIVCACTKTLVQTLSHTTLLKLALITWHFDASGEPSEGLSRFLRQPGNSAVWEAVHSGYRQSEKKDVSLQSFKISHDFLLWPALC